MSNNDLHSNPAEVFAQHRPWLFGIAYRMLGSVMDAEDVVQEAYLRWERADREPVESPRAYLSTIVTRLSIDALREAQRRHEVYVGAWLPEPLVTGRDPRDSAELADSLSTAFLVLLESLSPPERAAFLLREVFGYDYAELAQVLEKSEANCRQMVSRARGRIESREQRFEPSREEQERLLLRFVEATASGDYEALASVLAEDAAVYSDHGGKATAARRTILGPDKIARFFIGVQKRFPPADFSMRLMSLNGLPGAITFSGERPDAAFSFECVRGKIGRIYVVRNPDKLKHLGVFVRDPASP
jgi:RNA polymerase sigma-70 factor (ECF subfamily)